MSNLVFPTLPGARIALSRAPTWESTVQKSVSGCSVALTAFTYPIWKYSLQFEFLRSGAEAELQAIVGFFNRHYGRTDTWLFDDDEDNTATAEVFGVGDGTTREFWLTRIFGGFIEPVTDTRTLTAITINGVATTAYVAATGGKITFATAPAAGAQLRWTGTYYRRCRFDDDVLDTDRFLYQLWEARSVAFVTAKVRPA